LDVKAAGERWRRVRAGGSCVGDAATRATRTPAGHSAGDLEAFAKSYRDFMADLRRIEAGEAALRD